ncbi:MAG: TonB-dependent receptor [Thermomonas sp.]|uniref:TonB-dependent receptor n=1 Tax=Thermomonas sp. TaxID=1971895 RepID=UPI002637D415|nr:TonB-dependent receptor [Thermomonas sp.]MCC7096669.1 TonB-dependent receptor [Thermomonas sp.]
MKRKQLSMAIQGALVASLLVGAPALAVEPVAAQGQPGAQEQTQAQPQTAKPSATAPSTPTQLETVTVTARRVAEPIQEVPVAVSAFGETQLRDMQAAGVDGIQGSVPNLNIVQGRGSANSINVFIRGIGQPDALQTFDPGVGMYVDDVYYSRINGAMFSLFDIDQIEVLRGPQGTLYGKNSTGGAIKLSTKSPFDYEGGSVEATFGNYGRAEGRFYVGGRLSDTVAGSIAGAWISNNGFVRDAITGRHFNGDDTRALRAKFAFRPSDAFDATISFDYTHQDAALTLGRPTAPLVAVDMWPGYGPYVLLLTPTGRFNFRARTSFGPDKGQDMTHKGVSLVMNWNINDAWLLKSITAWRKLDTASYIDIDASQYELGDVFVGLHQRQWSQELQLQYHSDSIKAILGAYYLNERLPSHQEAYADDLLRYKGVPFTFLRTIDDDLRTTSTALFANIDWDITEAWSLAAGVRWSRDRKSYFRTTSAFFGPPLGAFSADPQAVIPGIRHSWSAVTPSVSLKYRFSDNVMGYVSANRGFKSGGFNGRANSQAESNNPIFDPEFVWTYEVGLKVQSADHRSMVNLTAFHSNYRDFQARVSEVVQSGGVPTFAFPVLNAARMTIDGFEIEGSTLLGKSTMLSGQLSWMNARYRQFVDLRVTDPTRPDYNPHIHDHVPFSPEFTGKIALQHGFEMGNGSILSIGGDVSYRSETWLSVDNRPNLRQSAYALVGLFGVWDSPQGAWQVRAGVRNLTNKTYMTEGQEFSSVGNIQTAYFGWPRNWYLSVRYNF